MTLFFLQPDILLILAFLLCFGFSIKLNLSQVIIISLSLPIIPLLNLLLVLKDNIILSLLSTYIIYASFLLLLLSAFLLLNLMSKIRLQLSFLLFFMFLINGIFTLSPIIDLARNNNWARNLLIKTSLQFNPAVIIGANVMKYDILKQNLMYHHLSNIGGYYMYSYPSLIFTVIFYSIISLIFFGIRVIISKDVRIQVEEKIYEEI